METSTPNSIEPAKSKKPMIALIVSLALIVGAGSYFFSGGNTFQGKLEIGQNSVKTTIDGQNIKLEWQNITNTEKYLISRSNQPGQSPAKNQIATSKEINYLDTSAIQGSTNYYTITATGKKGRLWISDEVAVTIPASITPVLTAPILTFEDGSTSKVIEIDKDTDVKLQWIPVAGAYKYLVAEKNEINGAKFSTETMDNNYTRKFMRWDVEQGSNTYTYTVFAMNKAMKPTEVQQISPTSNQIKIKIDIVIKSSMDLPSAATPY